MTKQYENLACIACINKDRAIGHNGKQLYNLSADLKNFAQVTKQNVNCIVSLQTLQSIGCALTGRFMYIVTHDPDDCAKRELVRELGYDSTNACILTFDNLIHCIETQPTKQFVCIGGGTLYTQLLPMSTKLYLTIVNDIDMQYDTVFPSFQADDWRLLNCAAHHEHDKLTNVLYEYAILTLERQYKNFIVELPWYINFIDENDFKARC